MNYSNSLNVDVFYSMRSPYSYIATYKMKELSEKNFEISREEVSRDEALNLFDKLGEHYKSDPIQCFKRFNSGAE